MLSSSFLLFQGSAAPRLWLLVMTHCWASRVKLCSSPTVVPLAFVTFLLCRCGSGGTADWTPGLVYGTHPSVWMSVLQTVALHFIELACSSGLYLGKLERHASCSQSSSMSISL